MEHKEITKSNVWWKKAVIYQIYPRSFQDSNGDGIGDLKGIMARLDYLKQLGVDALWLCPVYRSPQADNGYDISDYQDIDPVFGSLEDMEELIREAGSRGIRIVMDQVLNHSSDEHYWFREACKSRENPYHDYYVWRDGKPGTPPNDMQAAFGGSAWEWVPEVEQYYFHQFAVKQPDLNWENPRLRGEIRDMLLWWMDKGVGGFRLDVIDQIAKEPDRKITANGPRLHEYLRELSAGAFQKGDLVTVGEAWGATLDNAPLFSAPDGSELSMVFQFEHLQLDQDGPCKWDLAPLDFLALKKVLAKWQTGLYGNGWNSLFWNNHDLPRIVSRWGNDGRYRIQSAKMLATLLYGMQGTPYVYQGEEIGMTNVDFALEDYRDIESVNMYKERLEQGKTEEDILRSLHARSRDNARTPMQWDSSFNGGFTEGAPWIRLNPNHDEINVENALKDENSVFYYYQKLIALRKQYEVFTEGDFTLLYEEDQDIFAYLRSFGREKLIVAVNFHGEKARFAMPEDCKGKGQMLIHNYQEEVEDWLRPYEAFMVRIED